MKIQDIQIDMKVRFHPIIGGKHDGNIYTVRGTGQLFGRGVAWLDGKSGCVAVEALSVPRRGLVDDGLGDFSP